MTNARDRFIAYCTGPEMNWKAGIAEFEWDYHGPMARTWRAAEKAGRECARDRCVAEIFTELQTVKLRLSEERGGHALLVGGSAALENMGSRIRNLTDDELAEGGEG